MAKSGDNQKLAALVKEMEIPNYEDWFTKTYGAGKGKASAGPYGAELGNSEEAMQELFAQFARQDGEISTPHRLNIQRGRERRELKEP